jgi:hypothetical protein
MEMYEKYVTCEHGQLLHVTPGNHASFFGFYDICPWSYDNERVVMLTSPADFLLHPSGQKAGVAIWNPETGTIDTISETCGWNWQHGARQRWLRDGSILFNDVIAGNQCSHRIYADSRKVTYPMSISALHPNEQFGISANYSRLAQYYSTYGYSNATNGHIGRGAVDDGFWKLELEKGSFDCWISYEEICEALKIDYSPTMFVTHPDFSPIGDRFEFFLIQDNGAGTALMRLVVYDLKSRTFTLISEEKASHPTWIDDFRLWSWARESSAMKAISRSGLLMVPGMGLVAKLVRRFQGRLRNTLLSEGFFIYDLKDQNKRKRIGATLLTEDGHYSRHPSLPILVGDTYPDATGYLTLLVFSLVTGNRVEVARVKHDVRSSDLSLRCDLHPRWNRDGTEISVDICIEGVRRVAIFDASAAISKASI